MKFGTEGFPLVVLSHRKDRYIERTLASIRQHAHGVTDVIVVDDSGDVDHWRWLDSRGIPMVPSHSDGINAGYLTAMDTVWRVSRNLADQSGTSFVMLWEEDFRLIRGVSLFDMAIVLGASGNERLAHLNLQRQSVYRIERRLGYMESHQRRGYGLTRRADSGVPWVSRRTPFTTNPGLIKREVLDIEWPTREVCDTYEGGAEPAMSGVLEKAGYHFGWLGPWNTRYTTHVSAERQSGHGY